jgi:hypothetical protein
MAERRKNRSLGQAAWFTDALKGTTGPRRGQLPPVKLRKEAYFTAADTFGWCGFEPHREHQINAETYSNQRSVHTGNFRKRRSGSNPVSGLHKARRRVAQG